MFVPCSVALYTTFNQIWSVCSKRREYHQFSYRVKWQSRSAGLQSSEDDATTSAQFICCRPVLSMPLLYEPIESSLWCEIPERKRPCGCSTVPVRQIKHMTASSPRLPTRDALSQFAYQYTSTNNMGAGILHPTA